MSNTSKSLKTPLSASDAYRIGDRDERPWGHYVVTSVGKNTNGEEYCEKIITVRPGQALSLQSHQLRRETWIVKKGVLTVIVDGKSFQAPSGGAIHIPQGSIHCMANLGHEDCVVEEKQEGICREEDIERFADSYNRDTKTLATPSAAKNISAYKSILAEIEKNRLRKT